MYNMENNKNLYKKLLELQRMVKGLKKDKKSYGYDYVSGDKLLGFVRPAMDELGLLLIPNTEGVEQQIVETVPQTTNRDGSFKPAKNETLVLLHKTFTWVDVESGESLTTHFYSQGCNGWDKAIGSAETYAERYFILKFFHLATDEDDVSTIAREGEVENNKANKPEVVRKGAAPEPQQPSNEGGDGIFDSPELQDAIEAAKNAETPEELTKVWKDWKPKFGTYHEFVDAVKNNPNHPSHKK